MTTVVRETCSRCKIPMRAHQGCRLCWIGADTVDFWPIDTIDAWHRWSNDVEGAHALCDGECTRCNGVGEIEAPRPRDPYNHYVDCPCVAAQRVPELWRPLLVINENARGLVFDREDQPRVLYNVEDAPDVPDWWRDPRVNHIASLVAEWRRRDTA